MTVRLRAVEAEVLQCLAAAPRVFCFFDYDGTLAPLAPTPDEALPLPGTAALLQQLAAAPGVLVAVVTGRTIADVRQRLDVPGIFYVGIHGLEVLLPNGMGELSERAAVVHAALPGIKQQVQRALGTLPGIFIEDKGFALACHYRLASRADAAAACQTMATVARAYQRRGVKLALIHGHEVVEIRPAYVDKGRTARALIAAHAPGALAFYIGDDRTDEDAFARLPPESITIRVGASGPTRAHFRVASPVGVQRFLRALLECRTIRTRTDVAL